jgi:general secretion pathway protein L
MAEVIILRCHDRDGQHVSWQAKGGLQTLTGEGALSEAAEAARGRRTLVLIPASEILITQVKIPTRNHQRLLQAIPFSLETELTQDIEQLHFAAGATDSDNRTPVLIIARQKLENWLSLLQSAGLEPVGLYADLLCLPWSPNSWTLYQDEQILLAHTGPFQGFCADRESALEMLQFALQQAGESAPQQLILYRSAQNETSASLDFTQSGCEVVETTLESPIQLTSLLADNLSEKRQINLLQGEYQKLDKLTLQWKRWLPAALLAVAVLFSSLTLNVIDYYRYQAQSSDLDGRIRQVFRQAFPDIKRVVDPKVQMEQQLKLMRSGQAGGSAQFLSLFIPTASVLKESPNTTLEGVSFRDGQLDLQLTIKELQALESLKKSIEQKRLGVEIRTANAAGDKVTSQLRISGGGK